MTTPESTPSDRRSHPSTSRTRVPQQRLTNSLVDLDTFALLAAVARTGSVSAAAAELGVTQQAASARIGRTERALRHTLLRRGPNGSELTEHGAMVVEWAEPVLQAAERAAAALQALRDQEAPLTVAASQTVAEFFLPRWLSQLAADSPGTRVRVVSGNSADVTRALLGEGSSTAAQLGFVEGPSAPPGFRSSPITRDELVVVVAARHPWAGTTVTPRTLAHAALVTREPGSGTRATLERWLDDQGLRLSPPAAEFSATAAIRASVRAGLGPAVLSRRAVAEDLAAGSLVEVDLDGPPLARVLTAVWRGRPSSPARALLDIARAVGDPSAARQAHGGTDADGA